MMEMIEQVQLEDEPIGIIISRGSREEAPSRFTAYVWGPVPGDVELAEIADENRAA
jgi:hypothetical protein